MSGSVHTNSNINTTTTITKTTMQQQQQQQQAVHVAHDLICAIEYCGIDRDGYTDRDPKTASLCDVQLIGRCNTTITTTTTPRTTTPAAIQSTTFASTATRHDDNDENDTSETTDGDTTDTDIDNDGVGTVWACRFVLASRSVVLHRMLYGNFREAKSQSIALLRYPILILQSIVYFCSYHGINPLFPTTIADLELQLLFLQAADYLQLTDLCTMITQNILMKHLSIHPERSVCIIHGQCCACLPLTSSTSSNGTGDDTCSLSPSTTTTIASATSSSSSTWDALYHITQQMIETRPYITLDPNNTYSSRIHYNTDDAGSSSSNGCRGNLSDNYSDDIGDFGSGSGSGGITILSLDKVQHLFSATSKPNICASEHFLLHQLLRWYHYHRHQLQLQLQQQQQQIHNTDTSNTTTTASNKIRMIEEEMELLTLTTKQICTTCIDLSHVEPEHLLQFIPSSNQSALTTNSSSTSSSSNILTSEQIYQAISQQAIRASQCKSWSLPYTNGSLLYRNTTTTMVKCAGSGKPNTKLGPSSGMTTTTVTTTTIPERVLVEGSGHHDADGLYYRIATNSSNTNTTSSGQSVRRDGSVSSRHRIATIAAYPYQQQNLIKNVLYTKREIMVGQQNVYTLSRCLRYRSKQHGMDQQRTKQQVEEDTGSDDDPPRRLSEEIGTECLIGNIGVDADNDVEDEEEEEDDEGEEAYYECRIFSSPFLTYRAVRQLQVMQIMTTIVPCYQPVMQLLEWSPPATSSSTTPTNSSGVSSSSSTTGNNRSSSFLFTMSPDTTRNSTGSSHRPSTFNSDFLLNSNMNMVIPTPIRKFYRIRVSDGEYHMPGTLAPELNGLMERNELDVNRVIQILEFGVYTTYGCTSIHVLKAVVVTGSNTSPIHVFGNPTPLEDTEPIDINNIPDDIQIDRSNMVTKYGRLQNLYRAEVIEQDDPPLSGGALGSHLSRDDTTTVASSSFYASGCIPKTGWIVDDHGIDPAPECTWIPSSTTSTSTTALTSSVAATDRSRNSNTSNRSTTTSSVRSMARSTSSSVASRRRHYLETSEPTGTTSVVLPRHSVSSRSVISEPPIPTNDLSSLSTAPTSILYTATASQGELDEY